MSKKSSRNQSKSPNLFSASLFDDDPDAFIDTEASDFEVVAHEKTADDNIADTSESEPEEIAVDSAINPDNAFRFISFGSGSSGNCAYIGTATEGVLIDAGIDDKKVYSTLAQYGITPQMIKGICLTHDHGDHVRYAYTLVRKYRHMGVYCTPRTLEGIFRRHNISRSLRERHVPIFKEIPFKVAGMQFTAFEVPHDGSDNAGFFIEHGNLKFAVATDIGNIASRARFYLKQANFIMLESNYDLEMLESGTYPEYLKSRIRNDNGHLQNEVGAKFIAENYTHELRYLFLCHLSKDNNTPEKALAAYRAILSNAGITIGEGNETIADRQSMLQLIALPRYDATARYILR